MKKALKWTGIGLASLVALIIILSLLFYFPPFQNWAVRQAARVASEKTGMTVTVDNVRLAFPLDLSLNGVKMMEPNDSIKGKTDTVADVRSLVVSVEFMPLLKKQVMVDDLSLLQAKVNTTHFISNVRISGKVGRLKVRAHGIDLSREHVRVNSAILADADINVALADTAKRDTTPSQNFWKINLDNVKISNTAFALQTPGDTIGVAMRMDEGKAQGVFMDLYKSLYSARHIDWQGGWVTFDQTFRPRTQGIDPNHLALSNLSLSADSFFFCSPQLRLALRSASFHEKSGMQVASLRGPFRMDSLGITLPGMWLTTPSTNLYVAFRLDNAADSTDSYSLSATLRGSIGSQDIRTLGAPYLPKALAANLPRVPLVVNGTVGGNMQKMHIRNLYAAMPGIVKLRANGFLANLDDTKRLKADVSVNANAANLDFVKAMLPKSVTSTVNIPHGIGLRGHMRLDGPAIAARFNATQGGGSLGGNVSLNTRRMAYAAKLAARRFPISHFVKGQPIHPFTGTIAARGQGTDFRSSHATLNATANINRLQYAAYNLDNIKVTARLGGGHLIVNADSRNKLFKGLIGIDALTSTKFIQATLSCDLAHADLQGLGFVKDPINVSVCGQVDVASDLKKFYQAQGSLSDITLSEGTKHYRPNDVVMDILTNRDTTRAVVDCNDFHLNLHARGGYERLVSAITPFINEMQRQMTNKEIDQARLRSRLPQMQLYLVTGNDNFIARALKHYGMAFDNIAMDITSSPRTGINGTAQAYGLVVDSMAIDTVRLQLASADKEMKYNLEVVNGPKNPQITFHALLDGAITEHGTWMKPRIYDAKGRLGVGLDLMAKMENKGIAVHLTGNNPILGYKEFAVNDSNFVYLGADKRVRADMKLTAPDGTGVQIYSDDTDEDALQDITMSLNRFNLGNILAVIPYAPDIKGIFNGDFHLIQTKEETSLSSSFNVENLTYSGCPMGNVGTEFTYMPKSGNAHYVDGIITKDGAEIGNLSGTYYSTGKGVLDANLDMKRMPMDFLNGFIPDKLIGFKGYAEGDLTLKGSPTTPDVNGEVYLDSCYMYSEPYGVEVRFANDPVDIKNSRLVLENFEVFSHNDEPLNISGSIDFADLSKIAVNTRMRATNYLLVDAKETARSEAFGKAYVNFFGTANGLIDNLKVRGVVNVLGTTDLEYNLKDSPLSTDDQLQGLVEFTNFSDTTQDVVNKPPLTGLNMDLSVTIDDGAHIDCYLNSSKSNYIDVIGGGSMRMQYNVADGIILRGRYTIGSGEMKYELPVIPLKTFTIADGSYIEFTGDPMNPRLSITATEQTKSTVGAASGNGRVVNFTCGVNVSKTLQDMGLEFTIDAPEDMTIHNQLQAMTKEERGKMAVAMLTTGMYLAEGNTASFSMNSALSAFLNAQINQISGKALKTLDIGFGVDNSFTGSGQLQTDYSFKFARRFWNNRLKISIGGKISTGPDVAMQNETFFDNVSLEYRLSALSNKYLSLYYIRDSYDWLEGNVSKFGGGFLWRKKMNKLSEILRFWENDETTIPNDSAKNKKSGTSNTTTK